ncbi:MAG TPA: pectinesterase family protein, partial [Flavisolibacter sp.]|nr:pectinesterase family protein [Flavisolibacter sp.]
AVAGFSAGGQLAALLGNTMGNKLFEGSNCNSEHSSNVQAIVDMDGILAFIHPQSGEGDDSKRTSAATYWFGYAKKENSELWKQASALTHVSNATPPTLFINSSVARMHAGRTDYLNILEAFDIYNEVKTFEGAPHSFPLFHPWFDSTVHTVDAFLRKVFKTNKLVASTIIVAQDGSGQYKTVQEAFNAVPANNQKPIVVYVRSGVYREKLFLDSTKSFVTLIGEDKFRTILSYNDHTGKLSPKGDTINTYTSHSFLAAARDFTARNISFENTAGFTAGQAVAIQILGDRAKFINCRFIGNQDVLFPGRAGTRQYFERCYIEGTTDFIFGPSTAWFEGCHIHSKKNSHVTAASTPKEQAFGYVFNDCVFTGDTSLHNVSLGRPWRPYAHVAVMSSYIGPHIKTEGWANWNNTENYRTTKYAEHRNFGPGANVAGRIAWSRQLSEEEVKVYTLTDVLNGWNPKAASH